MIKEFVDDIQRVIRDRAVNREKYHRLRSDAVSVNDVEQVLAQDIRVGDILVLRSGQRVPTDCVILHLQNDGNSVEECFIKTDQLDGETDWKMRKALNFTQGRASSIYATFRPEPFLRLKLPTRTYMGSRVELTM